MADVRNVYIDQGTDVAIHIQVSNTTGGVLDLTDFTHNASYKRHPGSANSGTFTTAGYANGLLTLSLTDTVTATIDGIYIYEARLINTGTSDVTRVQEGRLIVKGSAS